MVVFGQVLSKTFVSLFHLSQVGSPRELLLQKREASNGTFLNYIKKFVMIEKGETQLDMVLI